MLKLNRIEKLDEDYVLVSHPYPNLDGELLLFQIDPDEQEDKECIMYKDFSLRRRWKTAKNDRMTVYQKKKQQEEDQVFTRLQCSEIDIEMPFSTIDWENFTYVLNETKGMGWAQILPVGQKSSTPF